MKLLLASALTLVALVSVPAAAFAATYAYVNQSGEVMTTESSSANSAIMTAPNIHARSGVMLLSNPSDGIVGDNVSGI